MKKRYLIGFLLLILAGCTPVSAYKGSSNSFEQNDLMRAIYFHDAQKVKELVQEGANLYEVDIHGATILHYTALYGTEEIANYLMEQPLEQLHLQKGGIRNNLPVQDALLSGNMGMFTIFSQAFPGSLNEIRDEMGRSLLHYATIQMDELLITDLLESGLDPNLKDINGNNPGHLLLLSLDTKRYSEDQGVPYRIAENLISNGMVPDALNHQGMSFRMIVDSADGIAFMQPDSANHSLLDSEKINLRKVLHDYDEGDFESNGD